jgi:nucleoside 2-deoxyribosyltransferase
VFLPNAVAHAATKVEICRRFGLRGLPPLNEDAETAATELEVWQVIYEKDVAIMEKSDIIIANLTPFAGASADAGTLIEVGWFLGKGKPILAIRIPPKTSNRACGNSLAQSMQTSASRVFICQTTS